MESPSRRHLEFIKNTRGAKRPKVGKDYPVCKKTRFDDRRL